jgi:NAD(P)H-dependent FMN reductase
LGSTRPNRFGIQPAEWIMELAKDHAGAKFELVDLADVNLPFLDEPEPPIAGNYVNEHTKAWAKIVDEADGYIIITPEYNHGVAASLKNAIDFAAQEWYYKPVGYVSYGATAGGIRAVEHLHNTFVWLRAYNMFDELAIQRYWHQLDDNGKFVPTDHQAKIAHELLDHVAFWAQHMKQARLELKKQEAGGAES